MRRHPWFLPEMPDVVGLLRRQLAVTIEGLDAFADWARGDAGAAERLQAAGHRAHVARREAVGVLRAAFVTAVEPEDAFALSRCFGWILDFAADLVTESTAMRCPPDAPIADMAVILGQAARHLDEALAGLPHDRDRATAAADAALAAERLLEAPYLAGMAAALDVEDRQERIARRELYRRCARIGEPVVDAAERVVYAVVKQG